MGLSTAAVAGQLGVRSPPDCSLIPGLGVKLSANTCRHNGLDAGEGFIVLIRVGGGLHPIELATVGVPRTNLRRVLINAQMSGLEGIVFSIPGLGVKLSAGPTVLSAVGASPPHDGVRRRRWINVASAVSLVESSQTIGRSHHRHRPGRDVFFPPRRGNPEVSLC